MPVCCCPHYPLGAPFPSRQETSPESQPAAVCPPSTPGPRSHTLLGSRSGQALRLRPGSRRPGRSRGGRVHRPLLLFLGLAPYAPTPVPRGIFRLSCWAWRDKMPPTPASPLASDSEKAWNTGTREHGTRDAGVKGPLFWSAWRKRAEARPRIPAGRVRGWRKAHLT